MAKKLAILYMNFDNSKKPKKILLSVIFWRKDHEQTTTRLFKWH